MQVIILAGGRGTRISEESGTRPKPMVEIGGRPMLWHIMNIYAAHECTEFVIACGYRGEMIKEYFHNFAVQHSDFIVDLRTREVEIVQAPKVAWRIGVIDTGLDTMTGGRVRRLQPLIGDAPFMVTYGDGLGDVDISALLAFHRAHGKAATITAVRPPARFGGLSLDQGRVREFSEKPQTGEGWINGGFFVFEPRLFEYLEDDQTILEREPLERLAAEGELMAYQHHGFWQPMDTLRERRLLEDLWNTGDAPWKVWS